MKVYIAGPMSGLPEHNYPAFQEATRKWRDEGHEVLCPTECFDGDKTREHWEYMATTLPMVLEAEAIAVLPDWSSSHGARAEMLLAQITGKEVYDAVSMERIPLCRAVSTYVSDKKYYTTIGRT